MSSAPLFVPYDAVSDYFSCPVCMCELENTCITPCGHRYCEHCIKECVDRHHKCPCCNASVRAKDLLKDHQFDELHGVIKREKAKSEEKYFTRLTDVEPEGGDAEDKDTIKPFSPIESILKKHLKDSLFSYERYYQGLQKEMMAKKAQKKSEWDKEKGVVYDMGLPACDIQARIENLQRKYEDYETGLEEQLQKNVEAVAEAYDRHLKEHIPQLSILPVKVKIILLGKSITLPDISLKPKDGLVEIRSIVKDQMAFRGDKLLNFGDDVKFFAFGPFAKLSSHEMFHMVRDILDHGASHPNIHFIPETCLPVIKFGLKPGSVIAVYGNLICESDLPKECFVETFKKGQKCAMDYFTCQECNLNWICRPCMESCHQKHPVVPYIMNHQPTWACCYCPKKKKCAIVGTNSMKAGSVC